MAQESVPIGRRSRTQSVSRKSTGYARARLGLTPPAGADIDEAEAETPAVEPTEPKTEAPTEPKPADEKPQAETKVVTPKARSRKPAQPKAETK